MGTFIIVQKSNGSFQFSLRAGNGRAILISPEFSDSASCEQGIEAVKEHYSDDANFVLRTSSKGEFYFNLETQSGHLLGSSDTYKNSVACHQDILAVKAFARGATVDNYYAGELQK